MGKASVREELSDTWSSPVMSSEVAEVSRSRIMYIENKAHGLVGPACIGRVTFSDSGQSIYYRGQTFRSLKGFGCKANYYCVETGEHYLISGCRRDGMDALYATDVSIDDDVREEYWADIRRQPENKHIAAFRAKGKH